MNQEIQQQNHTQEFIVARQPFDRRQTRTAAPPYLTEEGLVLVDRREGRDRRAGNRAPAADTQTAEEGESQLALERMKRLAALYGYQPAVAQAESGQAWPANGITTTLADAA